MKSFVLKSFVLTVTAATLALAGAAAAQPTIGAAPKPNGAGDPSAGPSPPPLRGPDSASPQQDAPRSLTNPQHTPGPGDTVASEARIRSMLEKQGYENVQNIRREGEAYTATASKGGESVNIRIDPQLGQIQEHGG